MPDRYIVTYSAFLGGWAVTSPSWIEDNGLGPTHFAEGAIKDTLPEAVDWAYQHAAEQWIKFYQSHTAPETVP